MLRTWYCRKSSPVDYDDGICKLDQLLHGWKTDHRNSGAPKYR